MSDNELLWLVCFRLSLLFCGLTILSNVIYELLMKILEESLEVQIFFLKRDSPYGLYGHGNEHCQH
jgi:hypothetical protein